MRYGAGTKSAMRPLALLVGTVALMPVLGCGDSDAPGVEVERLTHLSKDHVHDSPNAFFPGGEALLLSRSSYDFSNGRILVTSWPNSTAVERALFPEGHSDGGASLNHEGNRVLFTSGRDTGMPKAPDEWNLWSAEMESGIAMALPPPVNTAAAECCAVFAGDGSFFFSSNRAGSWDIYRARPLGGGFSVRPLEGSINSEYGEWMSHLGEGGRQGLISSIRPDGVGGDDLYLACLEDPGNDRWEVRLIPPPVNTAAYEDSGLWTTDAQWLVWASRRERPDGRDDADVYRLPTRGLDLACPRPQA